jgi:hypothetical protein
VRQRRSEDVVGLNDPIGYEEERGDLEWTPLGGLLRGARHGLVAAGVLAAALIPLAAYLPYMIAPLWLRGPLAFGLAWLLSQVVQRGAGMVGLPCSALAFGLTALVLASNHVVFALCGVVDPGGCYPLWAFPMEFVAQVVSSKQDALIGWTWFHPYALLILNLPPLALGGGFHAALFNRR